MRISRQRIMFGFLAIFILGFMGCQQRDQPSSQKSWVKPSKLVDFNPNSIEIDGDLGSFIAKWHQEEPEPGLQLLKLQMNSNQAETPPQFTLKWDFPSADIYQAWTTAVNVDKANVGWTRISSRSTAEAPVIALLSDGDQNRFTFASSDALNKVDLSSYIREEDARVYCSITFFSEKIPAIKEYTVTIRIDTRDLPYYQTLQQVSRWWASQEDYAPAPVPKVAWMPMYSTWYSFHQSLDVEILVEECRKAKQMGFEAIIVDDGWQTFDTNRGYAFTGDWEPERIPDMKGFVQRIHDLDMKFLLWYSVPFVGKNAKNYSRFKGKYLYDIPRLGTSVLDPRYPEVREFIIQTYEKALKDWNLDGFKLDFMGRFRATETTSLTAEEGRDFASVNRAVDRLMTDIMVRLRAIEPDIMIEFRQPYIGPLMRKYGNMFRATDCPNAANINRNRTTDIRILCDTTAVHSDMFMWHPEEPVEKAAQQILNILFSVPQLSVRLDKVPEDHFNMIRFWTEYIKENQDALLHGEFIPVNPAALYPMLIGKTAAKTIVGLYNDMIVPFNDPACLEMHIINAQHSDSIILDAEFALGSVQIRIRDCKGQLILEKKLNPKKGTHKFFVPPSGMIILQR